MRRTMATANLNVNGTILTDDDTFVDPDSRDPNWYRMLQNRTSAGSSQYYFNPADGVEYNKITIERRRSILMMDSGRVGDRFSLDSFGSLSDASRSFDIVHNERKIFNAKTSKNAAAITVEKVTSIVEKTDPDLYFKRPPSTVRSPGRSTSKRLRSVDGSVFAKASPFASYKSDNSSVDDSIWRRYDPNRPPRSIFNKGRPRDPVAYDQVVERPQNVLRERKHSQENIPSETSIGFDDDEGEIGGKKRSLFKKATGGKRNRLFAEAISYDRSERFDGSLQNLKSPSGDISKRGQNAITENSSDNEESLKSEADAISETLSYERFRNLASSTVIGEESTPRTPLFKRSVRRLSRKLSPVSDEIADAKSSDESMKAIDDKIREVDETAREQSGTNSSPNSKTAIIQVEGKSIRNNRSIEAIRNASGKNETFQTFKVDVSHRNTMNEKRSEIPKDAGTAMEMVPILENGELNSATHALVDNIILNEYKSETLSNINSSKETNTASDHKKISLEHRKVEESSTNVLNQSAIDRAVVEEMKAKRTNPPVRRSTIFIPPSEEQVENQTRPEKFYPLRHSNVPILPSLNLNQDDDEPVDSVDIIISNNDNTQTKNDPVKLIITENVSKSSITSELINTLGAHATKENQLDDLETSYMELAEKSNDQVELIVTENMSKSSITTELIDTLGTHAAKENKLDDLETSYMELAEKSNDQVELIVTENVSKSSITTELIDTLGTHAAKENKFVDLETSYMELAEKSNDQVELIITENVSKSSITTELIDTLGTHAAKENKLDDLETSNMELAEKSNDQVELIVTDEITTEQVDKLKMYKTTENNLDDLEPSNMELADGHAEKSDDTQKKSDQMELVIFTNEKVSKSDITPKQVDILLKTNTDGEDKLDHFGNVDSHYSTILQDDFSADSLDNNCNKFVPDESGLGQTNSAPDSSGQKTTRKSIFRKSTRLSSVASDELSQRTPFFNRDENLSPTLKEVLRKKFKALSESDNSVSIAGSSRQITNVELNDFEGENSIVPEPPRDDTVKNNSIDLELLRKLQEGVQLRKKLAEENFQKVMSGQKRLIVNTKWTVQPKANKVKNKTIMKPKRGNTENNIVSQIAAKKPKLYMKERWITKRLYDFVQKKMQPAHGFKTKAESERFVINLAKVVAVVGKSKLGDNNHHKHIHELKREMAREKLIETHFDFHRFVDDYLPFLFRLRAVPGCGRDAPEIDGGLFDKILTEVE